VQGAKNHNRELFSVCKLKMKLTLKSDSRLQETEQSGELFELLYRLPRELRNRVYTFCVQGQYDDEVIIRRSTTVQGATTLLVREFTGRHSYRWIEEPIDSIVKPLAIKHEHVIREMLEAYYWTRTFKVSHRELSLIGPFLDSDKLGLGMIPASYARRLHIQIQGDAFTPGRWSDAKRTEHETSLRMLEALGSILTARTEVMIEFDLYQEQSNNEEGLHGCVRSEDMLAKFQNAVERLKGGKLRVTVSCKRKWNE
jgi:hypothetical protein